MGTFNYASKVMHDGTVELKINLTENDADGAVVGTALFRGTNYNVAGQWAAAGSVADRHFSIIWFGGANSDASAFLVAAGDIHFKGEPRYIDIAVTSASAGDGDDFGFNDRIFCTDPPDDD